MSEFDLIMLGGGTGGLYSAVLAANMGKKVALVERGKLAGTCLNYGCTPTKSIIYPSVLYSQFKEAKQFGIEYENLRVDFSKVMERMRKIVSEGVKRNEARAQENENISLFMETGKFVNEKEVQAGGESFSAEKVFIATGASSFVPPIEGLDGVKYFTYRNILGIEKLPDSIIIIGGGFIGVEYASALNSFGSKVTVIQRGDKLIGKSDGDICSALAEYLREDGIDIRFGVEVSKVSSESEGVVVATKAGESIRADALMLAVGLRPNTQELNLEATGVQVNQRGFIEVDDYLRTSNNDIYAFGDVSGKKMFTHASLHQSEVVVKNAFLDANVKFDETNLPYAVFTNPEIGSVGITEEEARERGLQFSAKKAYYSDTSRGIITGEKRGFVKLIHDEKNILGCHAIGTEASNLVQEMMALMNCTSSYEVFTNTIHTHPTLFEIFEDLKS